MLRVSGNPVERKLRSELRRQIATPSKQHWAREVQSEETCVWGARPGDRGALFGELLVLYLSVSRSSLTHSRELSTLKSGYKGLRRYISRVCR